jgi:hypothetical protein
LYLGRVIDILVGLGYHLFEGCWEAWVIINA